MPTVGLFLYEEVEKIARLLKHQLCRTQVTDPEFKANLRKLCRRVKQFLVKGNGRTPQRSRW